MPSGEHARNRRRFLISTLPLFGHALPMMAVVEALCRRGHEVFWLSLPWQQDDGYNKRRVAADRIAERFGATALHTVCPPLDDEPSEGSDPRTAAIRRDLIAVVPHQVDEVRALLRAHAIDGVFQDPFLAQLQIACTLERIPFVCTVQGLRLFRSAEISLWSDDLWEALRPGFVEAFARYGLPFPPYTAGQLLSPWLNVVKLGPEVLAALGIVLPETIVAGGFPHLDHASRRALDVEVLGATPLPAARPDAARARVLVSFGTGGRNEAQERTVDALRALAPSHGLELILCDPTLAEPIRREGSTTLVRLAPLWDCMQHADLMVSHGGWGTTAQALRSGLPQLIVPEGFDQNDNGQRMQELGVAEMLVEPASITPETLEPRLARLLSEPVRARAQEVARLDAKTDGATTIASLLERTVAAARSGGVSTSASTES